MKTRHPRIWIHLMFLALQARSPNAMSSRDSSVTSLKNCWDTLKSENKSFLPIVTSAFPSARVKPFKKFMKLLFLPMQNFRIKIFYQTN